MTTSHVSAGSVGNGRMIRGVTFASCYVYSPSGSSMACRRSRLLRALLKDSDAHFIFRYALRVREQSAGASPLAGFFDPASVLVPIPGSAPRPAGVATVADHLAQALLSMGLAREIWPGLQRIRAVRKSATAAPGSRPTVGNHFDSFAIEPCEAFPHEVMLVDDVVTKGRTLLAAAARLQEACPATRVRAFALVRTMGLTAGVERLLEPCVGEIRWRAGDAHRNP